MSSAEDRQVAVHIDEPKTAFVKLWHPKGVQVSIPLTAGMTVEHAGSLLDAVDSLLTAGWLTNAPTLEEGEQVDEVQGVVRKQKENDKDGSSTNLIDLYSSNEVLNYPVLSVYLNTQDDIANFQKVSGLLVEKLPIYVGDNKIERGKSRQTDQFLTNAPHPFKVVHKANPRHDPNETDIKKKKPKRIFTKWHGITPTHTEPTANGQPAQPQTSQQPTSEQERVKYIQECQSLETLELCRLKVRATLSPEHAAPFLQAIISRVGFLCRNMALNAKTVDDLRKAEDESRKETWNLPPSEIRLIDEQIKTTFAAINKK